MNIEIRTDARGEETVIISGYVNAVERYSKPITDNLGDKVQTFIEKIKAGVFKTALTRNDDVKVLLNHDWDRELATTKDGSAKLEEDNIGLRAEVVITDKEVVEKARNNKLVGWSFGFYPNVAEVGTEGGRTTRTLADLDLAEVSILDDTKSPAYYGTSIEARSEGEKRMEIRENTLPEAEHDSDSVDVEQLAEKIAVRVMEIIKNSAEEKPTEVTDEETTSTEEVTEEVSKEETEEQPEKEETEDRAIDYSAYEQRISALK